jgi:hypothetical protein
MKQFRCWLQENANKIIKAAAGAAVGAIQVCSGHLAFV